MILSALIKTRFSKEPLPKLAFIFSFILLLAPSYSIHANSILNSSSCGPVSTKDTAGPYNYRTRSPGERWHVNDVNKHHYFKAQREMSKRSPLPQRIHRELSYTLIRIPNHHQALFLLARFHNQFPKEEFNPPVAGVFSVSPECFFDRGMRFVPDDPYVPLLKAIYYHKRKRYKKSLPVYKRLIEKHPGWGELHYNLGLLYADMKDYKQATLHANKAQENGYTLPGLKNKLEKAGHRP